MGESGGPKIHSIFFFFKKCPCKNYARIDNGDFNFREGWIADLLEDWANVAWNDGDGMGPSEIVVARVETRALDIMEVSPEVEGTLLNLGSLILSYSYSCNCFEARRSYLICSNATVTLSQVHYICSYCNLTLLKLSRNPPHIIQRLYSVVSQSTSIFVHSSFTDFIAAAFRTASSSSNSAFDVESS